MAYFWRTRIMLFKIETAYGVDPTPTGANNAILANDVSFSPMEGNDVDRDLDTPHFGNSGTLPAELHAKISFKIELVPSGTAGTAPAWGPVLRACAMAETIAVGTSVTYNPITDGQESATVYFYVGDTLFKSSGLRGNAKIVTQASGIPYLEFEFTGLFTQPATASPPSAGLAAFMDPLLTSKAHTPTFTIDGVALKPRSFSLDLGNQVEGRFLMTDEEILITDKQEAAEATVEAVALGTFNPWALAASGAPVALQFVHGKTAGKIATIDIPGAQMMRQTGLENAQGIVEWPLRLAPKPVTGNDQFTLTLT